MKKTNKILLLLLLTVNLNSIFAMEEQEDSDSSQEEETENTSGGRYQNYAYSQSEQDFLKAAKNNDFEAIKNAIKNNININTYCFFGKFTALKYACKNGKLDIVKFLIENGAEINKGTLTLAAKNGHIDIVKFLISKGMNVNSDSQQDESPIRAAVTSRYEDIINLLISNGAKLSDAFDSYSGSLLKEAYSSQKKKIINLLIKHGVTLSPLDKISLSREAIESCKTDLFKMLIKTNSLSSNITFNNNFWARKHKNKSRTEVNIDTFINIKNRDKVLDLLIQNSKSNKICHEILIKLYNLIANIPEQKQSYGSDKHEKINKNLNEVKEKLSKYFLECKRNIFQAIENNDYQALKENLLIIGSIYVRDEKRNTVLHKAVEKRNKELILLILSICPELLHEKNINGYTPIHLATNSTEILNLLINYAYIHKEIRIDSFIKNPNFVDNNGNNLLHTAVLSGDIESINFLMEKYPKLIMKANNTKQNPIQVSKTDEIKKIITTKYHELLNKKNEHINKITSTYLFYLNNNDIEGINKLLIALSKSPGGNGFIKVLFNLQLPSTISCSCLMFVCGARNLPVFSNIPANNRDRNADNITAIIKLLIDNGADINQKDNNGNTALHYAVKSNDIKAAELLLNFGADLHLQNNSGLTALNYANSDQMIELLKSHNNKRIKLNQN